MARSSPSRASRGLAHVPRRTASSKQSKEKHTWKWFRKWFRRSEHVRIPPWLPNIICKDRGYEEKRVYEEIRDSLLEVVWLWLFRWGREKRCLGVGDGGGWMNREVGILRSRCRFSAGRVGGIGLWWTPSKLLAQRVSSVLNATTQVFGSEIAVDYLFASFCCLWMPWKRKEAKCVTFDRVIVLVANLFSRNPRFPQSSWDWRICGFWLEIRLISGLDLWRKSNSGDFALWSEQRISVIVKRGWTRSRSVICYLILVSLRRSSFLGLRQEGSVGLVLECVWSISRSLPTSSEYTCILVQKDEECPAQRKQQNKQQRVKGQESSDGGSRESYLFIYIPRSSDPFHNRNLIQVFHFVYPKRGSLVRK